MKNFKKVFSAVVLLGATAVAMGVQAQQGPMGGYCTGESAAPGMSHCMGGGMGPGMQSGKGMGMGPGMMSGGQMSGQMQGPRANMSAMRQLMTDQERAALHDKMSAAKTPEEREKLRSANHAEMEKRAQEKGITLPPQHQQMMSGRHCG